MPLISVIMNVRNGSPFLREALNSVIAQTLQDWELIVWDDQSTDDSAQIVAEYDHPRIRYFLSPDDTTLGKARDFAIRQATGEWLAFLDQDDIWLPHKLERQMAIADTHAGIVYGRTVMFDSRGHRRDYDYTHEFSLLPEGNIFSRLFSQGCFIAMSSAVLRRSAVQEVGGIPETIEVVPDYYLYVAIARHYPASAVQNVVCLYRVHSGNMSRRNRQKLHQEPLFIINQWAPYLDPRIVSYRRMTYGTSLALEEMRRPKTFCLGCRRLLTDGSFLWLMSRPFAVGWRFLRRKVHPPYWLLKDAASDLDWPK